MLDGWGAFKVLYLHSKNTVWGMNSGGGGGGEIPKFINNSPSVTLITCAKARRTTLCRSKVKVSMVGVGVEDYFMGRPDRQIDEGPRD